MNPLEFLALAIQLANGSRPAEYRTAISRAYYAVYHVASELLHNMGFPMQKGPAGHGLVRHRLENAGDREVQQVGFDLGGLHQARIRADYRLDRKLDNEARASRAFVNKASQMILTLQQCRAEPKRTVVIKAIQDWEHRVSG